MRWEWVAMIERWVASCAREEEGREGWVGWVAGGQLWWRGKYVAGG